MRQMIEVCNLIDKYLFLRIGKHDISLNLPDYRALFDYVGQSRAFAC
jgi:hypothetical protein